MGDEDDPLWQPVRGRLSKGKGKNDHKPDIATAARTSRENSDNLTSYFFTAFPNSFGAKAMFNAFKYYGDIKEVVIPTKRDKGGRRFGFARFDRVVDTRRFETELDNIIIGRDKISVNLSRFQRHEDSRKKDCRSDVRRDTRDSQKPEERNSKESRGRSKLHFAQKPN
ncbi:hypothetical protein L195_g033033 [Trifolium pratense]|uniref:RRM domain-containing protein n=1 Tax=Trifolium pratense TaxID=57577 RepID=A0A2K3LEW1_TRIPR|nr:hypothetical protein L195_g033033 [Trifolium pratense]